MKTNFCSQTLKTAGILMAIGGLVACETDDVKTPSISYGTEVTIGSGVARSFVKLDDTGTATDIGFTSTPGV